MVNTSNTGPNPGDTNSTAQTQTPIAEVYGTPGNGKVPQWNTTTGRFEWADLSGTSGASSLVPTTVKTANYTAAASDYVPVDTTSSNVTVTLPTSPADKTQVGVKHVVRPGSNTITVAAGGTDKFNVAGGSATAALTLLNQGAVFQYAATPGLWYVISDDLPLSQLDGRYAQTVVAGPAPSGDTTGATDTAAIQAKMDAAFTAGGGTVQLQGGTFYATQLRLRSKVTLAGVGFGTKIIAAASGTLDTIVVYDANTYYFGVRDLWLDGNKASQTNPLRGIYLAANNSPAGSAGDQFAQVRTVIVSNTKGDGIFVDADVREVRLFHCYVIGTGGNGINMGATDWFIDTCTTGNTDGHGFYINNSDGRCVNSKAFWAGYSGGYGNGFHLAQGTQYEIMGCEAQDILTGWGFNAESGVSKVKIGGIAAKCLVGAVRLNNASQCQVDVIATNSGGSSITPTGPALTIQGGTSNCKVQITGASNLPSYITGPAGGNEVIFDNQRGTQSIAYAATITPNPYLGGVVKVGTLTGNIQVYAPTNRHAGCELELIFTQDATGGRTITVPANFNVNWTPVTTANAVNSIRLRYDGQIWQQIAASTGLAAGSGQNAATTAATPDSVANLVGWYKADAISGTNGSSVTSWSDLSGAGANFTTASGTPTLNLVNYSMPVVHFGAAGIKTASFTSMTDYTYFVVFAGSSANRVNFGRVVEQGGMSMERNGTTANSWYNFQNGGGGGGPVTLNDDALGIFMAQRSGTTETVKGNGNTSTTTGAVAATATGTGALALSMDVGGVTKNTCDIAELAIYSRALTGTEITQVTQYLSFKYGVTVT